MNYIDFIVIGIVVLSALLAFLRGFTREVLGIAAWIAAAFIARAAFPLIHDRFRKWIGSPDLGDAAALATVFIAAVVVLSFVSATVGGVVRASPLSFMDRTLGVLFGAVRGAALVVFAYIAAGWVMLPEQWPAPVLQARTLPVIASAASWAGGLVPADLHLHVPTLKATPETQAEELLHLLPQGRATGKPKTETGG